MRVKSAPLETIKQTTNVAPPSIFIKTAHKLASVRCVLMHRMGRRRVSTSATSVKCTEIEEKTVMIVVDNAAAPVEPAALDVTGSTKTFKEQEVVLAKDSGQLYEAKIQKVQEGKKGSAPQYFIHYQGWKSKWDRWVGAEDLLPKDEHSLKLQAQLRQATKRRPGPVAEKEDGREGGFKRGKGEGGEDVSRPADPDLEPAPEKNSDPQVKLAMPFTLKKQLVDDWELVTRCVENGGRKGGWRGGGGMMWTDFQALSRCWRSITSILCTSHPPLFPF